MRDRFRDTEPMLGDQHLEESRAATEALAILLIIVFVVVLGVVFFGPLRGLALIALEFLTT